WGVNPRRQTLAGQPCFARVEELPEAPDAVFLAVPRAAATEVVEALRRRGAGGVVCYAAGYGELGEDGATLERSLVAAAGDMALVGPNCYGLINYVRGVALWPFAFGGGRIERGVAVVTQSGMLGSDITMNRRSVPLAHVISAGNQAMLGIEDYLEVLVGDPAVAAIGLHLEGLRDVPRFCQAAIGALEAGVPMVVLKTGSSDLGRRLTTSHTGTLSGEDEVYQALFDRLGIIRVDSPVQLLETLKVLSLAGVPQGRRLAGFAASGGNVTLLADYAEGLGLSFPPPAPMTAEAMAALLPEVASVSNPLDYTTPLWGHELELTALFEAVLADDYDAALLVQDYPRPDLAEMKAGYLADARAFMAATRKAGLPAAVVSALPENIDRESRAMMIAGGAAPLQGIKEAMIAVAGAAAYGERRGKLTAGGRVATLGLTRIGPAAANIEDLSEWEGKQRLAATGIPVPEGRLADAATAPSVAEELGFPVAVKLASRGLAHKTEAGAVRLGLAGAGEVASALTAITDSVSSRAPEALCDTFLVERMAEEAVAEILIGIRRDSAFGHVLVLASGGTLVELVHDARTLLLPTDRESVAEALESLKVSKLLDGFRGRPAGDRVAVVDAVLALAKFAEANRESLEELEVNPLLALRDGVVAVDVLLRIRSPG
ncbi:MAG: acetate--CoA ligase family protein, partial [Kiloniellales bacterium]|nr:acetate--CoA ligase family protein [Kiloniellales bacterium]